MIFGIIGIYLIGYIFAYIGLRLFCYWDDPKSPWTLYDRFECLKFSLLSWVWLIIVVLNALFHYHELINNKIKTYVGTIDMKKKVTW